MKNTLLLPGIVLLVLAAVLCNSCSAQREIRVMSYNIRLSLVDDGENNWNIRRHASPEMIRTLAPDIIGLQESVNEQVVYLLEQLPEYAKVGVAREDGAARGEYSAVLFLKDKYEALADGTFWLSETPQEPSFGWDAACMRIVTWVHLRDRESDKELYVFNTHFDHIGKIARKESARLLVSKTGEIAGDVPCVFITGDFNAPIDDELFEPLKEHFLQARAEAPLTDSLTTYNGWGTFQGKPIDHIFYKGAKALVYHTVTENFGVPYVSDHYPAIATFKY
ncbi:MAG: endonuclease/exonuclease/phosphatase family protein [Bacteroidales bacterium]|jgi:endonuclease/exonuclease/phosphatase family metal-dependent hydrolase|nr:endonuclease/exonuclease/phosphatase family protein [Bacteroidales bacterium]MDD4654417.1 endonuclease/exonuclease/phosphatase family protein [Bacteroidales bacterium]HNY23548.1 endonuclease/exonuclease/phosphatase family protein [Bacteroidales bacterium]